MDTKGFQSSFGTSESIAFQTYKVSSGTPAEHSTSDTTSVTDTYGTSYLQVRLKYFQNIPAIRGLQQISRPGNRTYLDVKRILKISEEQN